MMSVRKWIRRKVEALPKDHSGLRTITIVVLFLILPQAVAVMVTGFSLHEVWKTKNVRKLWKPLLIWAASYVWLAVFWLGILPILILKISGLF